MTRNGNGPAGPEGSTMTDASDTIVSRSRLFERGGTSRAALMGGVSVMAMVIGGLPQVAKAQTVLSGSSYSLPTQTGTGSCTSFIRACLRCGSLKLSEFAILVVPNSNNVGTIAM